MVPHSPTPRSRCGVQPARPCTEFACWPIRPLDPLNPTVCDLSASVGPPQFCSSKCFKPCYGRCLQDPLVAVALRAAALQPAVRFFLGLSPNEWSARSPMSRTPPVQTARHQDGRRRVRSARNRLQFNSAGQPAQNGNGVGMSKWLPRAMAKQWPPRTNNGLLRLPSADLGRYYAQISPISSRRPEKAAI